MAAALSLASIGGASSWRAAGLTAGKSGGLYLLWQNTNLASSVSIWKLNNSGGFVSATSFNPGGSWRMMWPDHGPLLAGGTDNNLRLFWYNPTNGVYSIWVLNSNCAYQTSTWFQPSGNWWIEDVAAAPNNQLNLLWKNGTDGSAAIWYLNSSAGYISSQYLAPVSGWSADHLRTDGLSNCHVMWRHWMTNVADQVSVWKFNYLGGFVAAKSYGPYSGWVATGLDIGSDNFARLTWKDAGSWMSVWTLGGSEEYQSSVTYGGYTGWSPMGILTFPNGNIGMGWQSSTSLACWLLNSSGAYVKSTSFPLPSVWEMQDGVVDSDNNFHLLWVNGSQASIWTWDANMNWGGAVSFAP